MAPWGHLPRKNLGLRFADVSTGSKPKLILRSVCRKEVPKLFTQIVKEKKRKRKSTHAQAPL